jgi:invasion protein IalB
MSPVQFASSFTRRWTGVAVVAALALSTVPLAAQTQEDGAPAKNSFGPRAKKTGQMAQAQQQAPEVVATHGAWKIQCEMAPAKPGGEPEKQCGMVQTTRSEKSDKVGLTLVMVRAKQNGKDVTMMRIMAPIGVFLPTGIALEVDGGAIGRVPFTRCLPQVCIAFAEAQGPTLDKMRKGTNANFIIYEAPGVGVPMTISLSGFSAAYSALDKL